MKIATSIRNTFALLALIGLAVPALAALDVERSVSVSDENGGTLVMITTGTHDALGGESTTTATFTQFQPDAGHWRVEGEVVRSRERSADSIEAIYDGALEILRPVSQFAPERLDTLVFESLRVVRNGDGPVLSGTIVYNGEILDAAELPRGAARALARTLRFFHFA